MDSTRTNIADRKLDAGRDVYGNQDEPSRCFASRGRKLLLPQHPISGARAREKQTRNNAPYGIVSEKIQKT